MNLRSLWISIAVIVSMVASAAAVCPLRSEGAVSRVLPAVVQVGLSEGDASVRTVGSGVVVSSDGFILTAKHVISRSQHVYVKTTDGKAWRVLYYIADAHRDLALLKIGAANLPTVALGDSGSLRVGQEVYTFGFPAATIINQNSNMATVAKGIVSALKRSLPEGNTSSESDTKMYTEWRAFLGVDLAFLLGQPVYVENLIQVDAMMNPGSSGGALTDTTGRLVGICHSLVSNSGSSAGIHFAVEVADARGILRVAGIITAEGD